MGGKRLISFSVYGPDEVYQSGAIANAVAARQFFPGWTARFYVEDKLYGKLARRLEPLGAEVVKMRRKSAFDGTFWRFLAMDDPDVDAVIGRDVDALLCPRNKVVVDEWMASNQGFHIIRDHPHHRSLILAGLWGARRGVLPPMSSLINEWLRRGGSNTNYGDDQRFLSRLVYPLVSNQAYIHADFVAFGEEEVHPIHAPRPHGHWLGYPPVRGELSQSRLDDFQRLSQSGLQRLNFDQCPYL